MRAVQPVTPQRSGPPRDGRPRTPTSRSSRVASSTPQSARRHADALTGRQRSLSTLDSLVVQNLERKYSAEEVRTPLTPTAGERTARSKGKENLGGENVVVAVRVRSFLPREVERGDDLCIRMRSTTTEINDAKGKHPFTFDHCFWSIEGVDAGISYASQKDVYETLGVPVVENALKGFNAAVIAYGQTGSGKSYSIFGPPDSIGKDGERDEGLIPRVCKELLSRKNQSKGTKYKISASMIEIYNEKVYDLLQNRNQLTIRGDLQRGFTVPGRTRQEVGEYCEIRSLLKRGEHQKTFASTAVNERSSRAHTLFELEIRAIHESKTTTSKVTLCDLAGSERCKDARTEAGGKEFNQACQINMSLLCLGQCVENVVQRGSALVTEFRNSALTKLLKDSIGGNSKTIILTTISPSDHDTHTTMQALRFADRAKQIQTHAVINDDALWEAKVKKKLMQQIYQQRLEALHKEYELEQQQAELTEAQLRLESEGVRLQAEKEAIENQKQELMRSREYSEAERKRLEAKEQQLQRRLQQVQTEHDQIQNRANELEEQTAKLYADTQAVKREKEELEEEICFLQGKIEILKKQHEDEALTWQEERDELKRSHKSEIQRMQAANVATLERKEARFLEERKKYVEQMMTAVSKLQKDMQHKEERWREKEETWRRRINELEHNLDELRTETEHKDTELQQLRSKNSALEQQCTEKEEKLKTLGATLQKKAGELEVLQDSVTSMKVSKDETTQRLAALHSEVSSKSEELELMTAEMERTKACIVELHGLMVNGVAAKVQADNVDEAIQGIVQDASITSLPQVISRMCDAITAKHHKEVLEMKTEHAEEIAAVQQRISEQQTVHMQGTQELMESHAKALSSQQEHHSEELAAVMEKHKEVIEEVAMAKQAELRELKEEHKLVVDRMKEEHAEQVDTLERHCEEARTEILKLESEITSLRASLKNSTEGYEGCMKEVKTEMEQLDRKAAELTAEVERKEEERLQLQTKLQTVLEEREAELAQADKERTRLREKLEESERSLLAKAREADEAKRAVEDVRCEKETVTKALTLREEELEEAQAARERLLGDLATLKEKFIESASKNDELELGMRNAVRKKQEEVEEAQRKHWQDVEAMRKQLQATYLEELNAAEEQRKELQRKHKEELEEVETVFKAKLRTAREEAKQSLDELSQERAKLASENQHLKQENERQASDLETSLKQQREAERQLHELHELKEQHHAQELADLKKTMQGQIDRLEDVIKQEHQKRKILQEELRESRSRESMSMQQLLSAFQRTHTEFQNKLKCEADEAKKRSWFTDPAPPASPSSPRTPFSAKSSSDGNLPAPASPKALDTGKENTAEM